MNRLEAVEHEMEVLEKEDAERDKKWQAWKRKQMEICPHEEIEKSGGGYWASWPDWGCYKTWYTCMRCGKSWESNHYPYSEARVVKDDKYDSSSPNY